MEALQTINIEVPGDLQELNGLLIKFNQIHQSFIPCRDWLQCRLALAEGFTNAVRHAHKNIPKEIPIEIQVRLRRNSMEIRIWDYGSAFDLKGFINKTAEKHHAWLGSGRGIPLLNKIADRLDYKRTEQQKNCLIVFKKFGSYRQNNIVQTKKIKE